MIGLGTTAYVCSVYPSVTVLCVKVYVCVSVNVWSMFVVSIASVYGIPILGMLMDCECVYVFVCMFEYVCLGMGLGSAGLGRYRQRGILGMQADG